MNEYTVLLTWDNEARVWIAESDDIPGLILESESMDALIERVKNAGPELLELSGRVHNNAILLFKSYSLPRHARCQYHSARITRPKTFQPPY
jgi:predicted RNase H-like HicB family nuclease